MRLTIAIVVTILVFVTGTVAVVQVTHFCVRRSTYPPVPSFISKTTEGARALWESFATLDREYDQYDLSTISEDACTHRVIVAVRDNHWYPARSYPDRAAGNYPEIVGTVRIVKAGWPFHMLQGEEFWCDYEPRYNSLKEDELPVKPIFPHFALGALLYGIALWVPTVPVVYAVWFRHSKRRRKRGLCVNCAYPIGTSEVCTECGAAIRRVV